MLYCLLCKCWGYYRSINYIPVFWKWYSRVSRLLLMGLMVCTPKDAYQRLARMCADRKWALYKLRPKLHMQAELVKLDCFGLIILCGVNMLTLHLHDLACSLSWELQRQVQTGAPDIINVMCCWALLLQLLDLYRNQTLKAGPHGPMRTTLEEYPE